MQEVSLGDVRFKSRALEVLSAYQPFWLRLAMETVVGKAVTDREGAVKPFLPHSLRGCQLVSSLMMWIHNHVLGVGWAHRVLLLGSRQDVHFVTWSRQPHSLHGGELLL